MTVAVAERRQPLPSGAEGLAPWGLLNRIHRPCPDHGGEADCVGRQPREGRLVYWCPSGHHHFRSA